TDRRLVEDVEDADQSRADLSGQADALGLTAGERARGPIEAEVVEADVEEEPESGIDLLHHLGGHGGVPVAEFERAEEFGGLVERQFGYLGDGAAADSDREDLGFEAAALTAGAGDLAHIGLIALPRPVRFGLLVFALDVLVEPFEPGRVGPFPSEAVPGLEVDLVVLAGQDRGLRGFRQLLPRRRHVEAEFVPEPLEQTVEVLRDLFAARPGGART